MKCPKEEKCCTQGAYLHTEKNMRNRETIILKKKIEKEVLLNVGYCKV